MLMRRELILGPVCAIALLAVPTAAAAKDRNHDGLPDRWERQHKLSLKVHQANHDQDRDGLRNRDEFRYGLNPRNDDSDGDGRHDDDENSGMIQSFTGGVLTLKLVDGSTLAAKVTDQTEIDCDSGDDDHGDDDHGDRRAALRDHGDDDHGDDDHNGRGNDDNGDDDHGDDDHGRDSVPVTAGNVAVPSPSSCGTTADLVAGTIVHEATVKTTSAGAVFHEVELVK
jgi:hypothetical protein